MFSYSRTKENKENADGDEKDCQGDGDGVGMLASDNGIVIAASYWGKFKTVFQMVMIILMIADIAALNIVTQIVMWIALILTIVSLIDYLKKNWHVMGEQK